MNKNKHLKILRTAEALFNRFGIRKKLLTTLPHQPVW